MIRLNATYSGIEIQVFKAGIPAAADSTPTGTLFRNGSSTGVSITVSATANTGRYLASFTTLGTGDGWAVTDHLTLRTIAVIDGVSFPTISFDSFSNPPAVADANVLSMGANTVTASALATDAISEIQSGLATSSAVAGLVGVTFPSNFSSLQINSSGNLPQINELHKRQGLQAGVTATVRDAATGTPGSLVTSDSTINQTLTKNGDGSVTINRN